MRTYTVAVTGASGSAYGMRLVEQLLLAQQKVALVVTDTGRLVVSHELGFSFTSETVAGDVLRYLELPPDSALRLVPCDDMFDAIASGTHEVHGMVVIPASMGFCGSLAAGLASDVAERAADVTLKEKRQLVVVPRETPLSLIHLRNLTALAEAGACVLPAMPGFYHGPRGIDDLVNFVVGKVMDALGVPHSLFERWGSE